MKKRKANGGLLKPRGYKAMRSGLSYLFRRYSRKMDTDYFDELGEMMKGAKRIANSARQKGEGNIMDGKREMTFPIYRQFNRWCVEEGSLEAVYARCYSVHSWNLACRGDSTGKIRLKHLMWNSDCTGISFAHSKENQEGEDRRKRKPRHCYANGFDWEADYQSATFDYLCCFPEVMGDPLGQLFVGTEDASSKKFYNEMIRILKNHIEVRF